MRLKPPMRCKTDQFNTLRVYVTAGRHMDMSQVITEPAAQLSRDVTQAVQDTDYIGKLIQEGETYGWAIMRGIL